MSTDDDRVATLLCSPEAFEHAGAAARGRLASLVLERLGPGWSDARSSEDAEIVLAHQASGLPFVVVPGGDFTMGLTDEDVERASELVDWLSGPSEYVEHLGASALPPHTVTVKPFLCARTIPRVNGAEPAYFTRDEARTRAAELGLRIASEAELEWLYRDGGRFAFKLNASPDREKARRVRYDVSRFGVDDLLEMAWAADDWHPSYEGAPGTSEPWMSGDTAGVCRSSFVPYLLEVDEDLMPLLAAIREPGKAPCTLRLARDLPL